MARWPLRLAAIGLLGLGAAWFITKPDPLPASALVGLVGDAQRGAQVFHAGGCASCHSAAGAEGDARLILSGGRAFPSPFGTFYAPNISPDPVQGIGAWQPRDLANAMQRGVSPQGQHYFPAFPYTAYQHVTDQDIADLFAYLHSLPASNAASPAHEVGFPFNIRRSLGGWKWLFMTDDWALQGDLPPEQARGRYLVEALGHCGECHTPRGVLGGLKRGQWLAGAPNPSGRGTIPDITPGALDWSASDIAAYLKSGFTPDYDSAGGHMAEVVANFAQLDAADRAAVAAYLKAIPAVP